MKISVKPLDRLFSTYIRTKARWRCQRCGRQFTPPTNGLHCAHNIGRRAHNTRWNEFNAIAACYGCHSWLDAHGPEKEALFIKLYGKERIRAVRHLYNTPRLRVDKDDVKKRLQMLLADVERDDIYRRP